MGLLKKRNKDELSKALAKLGDALTSAIEYGELYDGIEISITIKGRVESGKKWSVDVDCDVRTN